MDILPISANQLISKTCDVLRAGGLVVYPSDTVYGLLVDATNPKAVKKLINFKNRPPGKAISVFVSDWPSLISQVEVTPKQERLLKEILPGPFTIILPSKHKVCSLLESEKGTLGVRLPKYKAVIDLCQQFGRVLTATSANLAGRSPHYSVPSFTSNLPQQKKELIDLIVDAGRLPRNLPSTVIDLTADKLKVIRRGDIEFVNLDKYISHSPKQTKNIAKYIVEKIIVRQQDRPYIFLLTGELGVGKTVFVKGAAELWDLQKIISPTFVVYYEYPVARFGFSKFYHVDLYNISEEEELYSLHLENLFKKKHIIFVEWGEKLGELYTRWKQQAVIVEIELNYLSSQEREIIVRE